MADHHSNSSQPVLTGMDAHRATYEGFLQWSVVVALISFFTLVALVDFRFVAYPFNLLVGFGGLIVGIIATLIGLRAGGKWALPVVVLVIYGVFVAMNAHMS
ncbi:hypothetical protein [Aestuariivirga litoralis]|uniref:hypothetical protein n=1 Tax=Aestuariivirga litoralis TaxID=2650924 RepID=UPI0018C81CD0|nr:hypothetical protein [Aestuariivirga litoralis]MBG1233124.1 hypothetical protein [Aestuariivirga litoralis]